MSVKDTTAILSPGDNFVEKGFPKFAAYEEGKPVYVYINRRSISRGRAADVWEFHVGSYQVCENG